MPEPEMDPRRRRSRDALHAAVLALAAEQDPTRIPVSALADRAGVHRSTVYEHADSPLGLLEQALRRELDQLRETHLRGVPPERVGAALSDVTRAVFAHVERHRAVYRRLEAAPGASLHAFLGTHFEDSSRLLLSQHALTLPPAPGGADASFRDEVIVRYVAAGVVGAIAAWLHAPDSVPVDEISADLAQLLPPWWPRAS